MNNPSRHIVIVAGEVSGDIHASLLVRELKKLDPHLSFSGLGGPRLAAEGVKLQEDLTHIAVVGFAEVLKNYPRFKKIFKEILRQLKTNPPAAVILVDYPGFNLRLAREIKKLHIPTIYYISPQVWAWKASRIKLIRQVVDKMLVLFEFEKDFYQKHGLAVTCVGHPLVDHIQVAQTKEQALAQLGWDDRRMTLGLLPGSRAKEVEKILPPMLDAAELLHKEYNLFQCVVMQAPSISKEKIAAYLKNRNFPVKIAAHSYDLLNACDLCLVASGTATLETAILQKPMVVVYKTSLVTWLLAKLLIKIPYIGLVNVVAGKKVVPECLQFQATGKDIASALKAIFTNELRIAEIKQELRRVKQNLGAPGATRRAAEEILSFLF